MKQDKIVFFKDTHTYWFGNMKMQSVGSWLKKYFPPFGESYWLTHGVLKKMVGEEFKEHYRSLGGFGPDKFDLFGPFLPKVSANEFTMEKRMLSETWERKRNESAWKGTRFHDYMEARDYDRGYLENPWSGVDVKINVFEKEYDNQSLTLDLSSLPDGAYLELLVFDLELGKAGQADMVFIETVDGVRYIDVNDHKTNEKKPQKSAPSRCLEPFENEYASTHFKYVLQINAYAYLLSRHGFVPRNLAYTHYKNYDPEKSTLVEVPILKNLENIFN